MGFWSRVGIGALGIGEVIAKTVDNAGNTLFDTGQEAIKDCKANSSAGNIAANVAKVTASTALSGVFTILGEGCNVGMRCYKEIKEDYEQEQAEIQRLKEQAEEQRRIREKEERERWIKERDERRERLKRTPVTSGSRSEEYTYSRQCYRCHRTFYIHREHFSFARGTYYHCPYCGAKPGSGW